MISYSALAAESIQPVTSDTPAPTDPTEIPDYLPGGHYIVALPEAPAATYDGGVSGLDATRPEDSSTPLDAASADVRAYSAHLREEQQDLAAEVGARPRASYTVGVNGFTANLTAEQATTLAAKRGVRLVPDVLLQPAEQQVQEKLGLTGTGGVWEELGGEAGAGRGVVIGIVDTGIWPENPFFAGDPVTSTDRSTRPGATYRTPGGEIAVAKADGGTFIGHCEEGEDFASTLCNSKIVSARHFKAGYLNQVPLARWATTEYDSPRDGQGHGSHTASTAAGVRVANTTVGKSSLGTSAGIAPDAKIAVYKTCHAGKITRDTGCALSDNIAAVEQAIKDGVDVINHSIGGGTPDDASSLLQTAFLSAATAGIFVAAAAGNDGPTPGSVDKNTPWVTSVAASTIHHFENTVVLGDGRKLRGVSMNTTPLPAAPLVLSAQAVTRLPDEDGILPEPASSDSYCFPGSLDPALVTGRIVVCDRGGPEKTAKSLEVARAGGVGMILTNPTDSSLDADLHTIPTVHVNATDRENLVTYAEAATEPRAEFVVGDTTGLEETPVPVAAPFSARGPAASTGGDLLKPDITAPGVEIIGAVVPQDGSTAAFAPKSGTSMAAPHVAGLAALLFTKHPGWSPMAAKSAMMTTAHAVKRKDGTYDCDPFTQGAGFVRPAGFLDPGLVYDSGVDEWMAYKEGLGINTGTGVRAIDPSDYNAPSVAIGELAGSQTVRRRVTATSGGTYRAVAWMAGARVTVSPRTLVLRRGETRSFTVRIERTTAPLGEYATGSLVWRSRWDVVHSPMVARPVDIVTPKDVTASRDAGSTNFEVSLGTTRDFAPQVRGLTAGEAHADSLVEGAAELTQEGNEATRAYRFVIPEGTTLARVDLDVDDWSTDFDLYLMDEAFSRPVALSGSPLADERIDLTDPEPGTYYAVVNAYTTHGKPASYTVRTFALTEDDPGNLGVSPDPVRGTVGAKVPVTLTWTGLEPDRPYLGTITFPDALHPTVVTVR